MSISLKSIIQTAQVTHPAGLPADCWFLNINSPADLARAQMLLERSLFARVSDVQRYEGWEKYQWNRHSYYRNRKLNVTGVERVGTFVTKTPYETIS